MRHPLVGLLSLPLVFVLAQAACSNSASSNTDTARCDALQKQCDACLNPTLKQACLTAIINYKSGGETGQKACQSAIDTKTYSGEAKGECLDICSAQSKCSAEPKPTDDAINECIGETSGACAAQYKALYNCILTKSTCTADNKLNQPAVEAACKAEQTAADKCAPSDAGADARGD